MGKFKDIDDRYFAKRDAFSARLRSLDPQFIADNFPLFSGQWTIARFLAISELVRRVAHLPGHFAELGCWNGTNLVFMAKLLNILKPAAPTEVFGFDSFEGLQRFESGKDDTGPEQTGRYRGSLELLEEVLDLYDLQHTVTLIKGSIEDTLPAFLQERKDVRFSFVYLDTDLYSSTRLGLELLYPRLLKGGIVVLDEYNLAEWPGETSALHDVLGDNVELHAVPGTRQPTAY